MRIRKPFLTVLKNKGSTIVIRTICPGCTHSKIYELDMIEYQKWSDGKFIQDAFPDLSNDDRERLISGICPSCWEASFK